VKILIRIVAMLPVLGMLVAWLVLGLVLLGRHGEQSRIIDDVRPLLRQEPQRKLPAAVNGRILVWDMTTNGVRQETHRKLPPERVFDKPEGPITVVAILDIQRDQPQQYNNGIVGYRQVATVRVVSWPEKKAYGTYLVTGFDPPFIVFRNSDSDKSPELGDLDTPLANWIKGLPEVNAPQYQDTLARMEIVGSVAPLFGEIPPLDQRVDPLDLQPAPEGIFARPRQPKRTDPASLPAVPGKFLVWDMKANAPSPLQDKLPAELRANPKDPAITVVAVLQTDEIKARTYQNGTVGYRRIVTLGLATWPEKKRIGIYAVVGDDPPVIHIGFGKDAMISRGEIDRPLTEWIQRLPRAP
jgi:hypothetical protein